MNTRIIVSVLVSREDDFLFIKQNKPGGAYPGTLHIPGGGLEKGETPEAAVRREIQEEAGIDIAQLREYDFDWEQTEYKGDKIQFIFLRYTAIYSGGTPRAGSDAKELLWIPRARLGEYEHNLPSKRLLSKLGLL